LLDRHGDNAIRAAFERGLAEGVYGHEYVVHYLSERPGDDNGVQRELPV
jgi:hypothetical protein